MLTNLESRSNLFIPHMDLELRCDMVVCMESHHESQSYESGVTGVTYLYYVMTKFMNIDQYTYNLFRIPEVDIAKKTRNLGIRVRGA